ncbi:hypothetical protein PIB30_102175 [Stylosanthes scabra]|uniref:Uncharacterized protein n=1 Tax=Stylosanthes scabra TaxID=79078 RepID=A0ABU6TZM4_9FABA|nr:hypothetical protein [Stylosanthes scabra]
MVHNENDEEEDEEDDDEWLYGLLAELEDSDDDSDDEEFEEEPEKEVDDEEFEEEPKGETFFIATIFSRNEVKEIEMPVKCEDPDPCLVTSKIRGVDIPECLCDPGACGNVMPYTLYETLDLGPLKKSKEVFTTVDASIVSVAVMLIMSCASVEGAHQLRVSTKKIGSEKLLGSKKEKEAENSKNNASVKKGSRIAPPSLKKDGKKESSKPAKKKKQHEEVKTRKKKKHEEDVDGGGIALKCSSLGNFLGKLKKIGKVLRNNKKIDAHLVKDQSKWNAYAHSSKLAEVRMHHKHHLQGFSLSKMCVRIFPLMAGKGKSVARQPSTRTRGASSRRQPSQEAARYETPAQAERGELVVERRVLHERVINFRGKRDTF